MSEEGGAVLAYSLTTIEPRPTAVLLINELMAIGLGHRPSQLGIAPGQELGVNRNSQQSAAARPCRRGSATMCR
jgi:DNA-binding LacI/PurR family transcriptional regulator